MAKMPQSHTLDLLTLTAAQSSELLTANAITSVDLVDAYLARISKHNHAGLRLNALISVAPKDLLIDQARALDGERAAGTTRGPLHGIPFIVKDVFLTSDEETGLRTSCGFPGFLECKAKRTAPLIKRLIEKEGMVLVGKANLTEFCGIKMKPYLSPGFSPAGGQTLNPYIFGGLDPDDPAVLGHSTCAGSSAGSAVGVAAGFAPLAIGTECCGSVIMPAQRQGLYGLKCGVGTVEDEGTWHFTDCIDHVGVMARSAKDLKIYAGAVMGRDLKTDGSEDGFEGLRAAFLDSGVWRLGEDTVGCNQQEWAQMERSYHSVIKKLKGLGAMVREDIDLPLEPENTFKIKGKSPFYEIAFCQLVQKHIPAFLSEFEDDAPIRSLEDIIAYNSSHKDICLPPKFPSQDELEDLLANTRTQEETEQMANLMRTNAKAAVDPILRDCGLVVALADSPLVLYGTACGYPVGTVPCGMVSYNATNSRPYCLAILAGEGGEGEILRFMEAWERQIMPETEREVPRPLREWAET